MTDRMDPCVSIFTHVWDGIGYIRDMRPVNQLVG